MIGRITRPQKFLYYSLLSLLALVILFPIYYMVIISLKLPRDIYRKPSLLPIGATIQNYVDLVTKQDFLINLGNSLLVASLATAISVVDQLHGGLQPGAAAYRYRDWIGRLILFSYLTPTSLLFIPLSIIIAQLKLGNSLHGLIFVYLAFSTPLSTWLLMGFFRSIPLDLEEQAMVDAPTACRRSKICCRCRCRA